MLNIFIRVFHIVDKADSIRKITAFNEKLAVNFSF